MVYALLCFPGVIDSASFRRLGAWTRRRTDVETVHIHDGNVVPPVVIDATGGSSCLAKLIAAWVFVRPNPGEHRRIHSVAKHRLCHQPGQPTVG